jgi:hypothetical protein
MLEDLQRHEPNERPRRREALGHPGIVPAMRVRHLAAIAVLALSSVLLTASCLQQSPTEPGEASPDEAQPSEGPAPTGEAQQATRIPFGSKQFRFRLVNEDDGEGEGAGWQEADAKLSYVRMQWGIVPTYHWQCRLRIGMPLRTKLRGRISPSFAAYISAKIANDVSDALLPTEEWQGKGAAFCVKLIEGMNVMFSEEAGLGARVNP